MAVIKSHPRVLRNLIGILILAFAIFIFIALVSNLFTGQEDQSEVTMGYNYMTESYNWAGKTGAIVAYILMNKLYGLSSFCFPTYLLLLSFKIFKPHSKKIHSCTAFIHLGVLMFFSSLVLQQLQNFCCYNFFNQNFSFHAGGEHGKVCSFFLSNHLGNILLNILLIVLLLNYVGYYIVKCFIYSHTSLQYLKQIIQQKRKNIGLSYKTDKTPQIEIQEELPPQKTIEDEQNDFDQEQITTFPILSPVIDILQVPEIEHEDKPDITIFPSQQPHEENPTSSPYEQRSPEIELQIENPQPQIEDTPKNIEDILSSEPYNPRLDLSRYTFPPISLLEKHDTHNVEVDMEEQHANKNRIINVLRNFGVEITGISATIGPTVTLYEIVPAPGIRVSKIKNLEDDIALSLAADGIRIIAPIPGKGTIGIEVPNQKSQIVSMESILNTQKFRDTKFELPLALGKTITNEVFMVDLAKMPHMLVAGATGQGKSVGLNAIVASLLYKKHPAELKLVMIDPKKVEFSMYNPLIKHFLAQVPDNEEPVITDTQKVIQTLKSLCVEMDDRYELLKSAHCKNLREYNDKFKSRRLNPEKGHRFLPYIVVVIDEYGDLIMTAGKDIEHPIARIAQLARAVGIHMIIATQSPRADIITGKIKANFPARMAFRVMGLQESRIILDEKGANSLIGRGDMLIMTGGTTTRVQCAFLDTLEVEAITEYISQQQGYAHPYELPLVVEDSTEQENRYTVSTGADTFEEVALFVVRQQQGSTSKIQRTFSIGFNRAGRLMDQLEEAGIVGPQNGSKPREVYVQDEHQLRLILDSFKTQGKKLG